MYRNISDKRYYELKGYAICLKNKIHEELISYDRKKRFNIRSVICVGLQDIRTSAYFTNEEIKLIYVNVIINDDLEFYENRIKCNDDFDDLYKIYKTKDELITREDVSYKIEEMEKFKHLMYDKDYPSYSKKRKKIYL